MKTPILLGFCLLVLLSGAAPAWADDQPSPVSSLQELSVTPAEAHLRDDRSRQQLVVSQRDADGFLKDMTRQATFESADPAVAHVDAAGVVYPRGMGTTLVTVHIMTDGEHPPREALVPVTVDDLTTSRPVSFANEVMAVLGKAGCNAGSCHGHQSGKGGFKLSLRGYEPAADYAALVHADFGRIDVAKPEDSLILLKPTAQVEHGGKERFGVDSAFYRLLKQWIAEGAQADFGRAPPIERVEVLPAERTMRDADQEQQLVVQAHFADGTIRDVTSQAVFELSNEGIIEVSPQGLVRGKREGEAAVFVRFLGQMGLARFLVLRHKPDFAWNAPLPSNYIDEHVFAKLRAIQVLPSPLSSDTEFLRRVSLDTVGLPPPPEEVRAFLADDRPDKRARKIHELLDREEFGEAWGLYWLELSGTTESGDSARFKGMWLLSYWLRDAFNGNLPYDQLVRALVAGKGSSIDNAAVTYGLNKLPPQQVVPQLFLGVRLECAECHDHPFDVWKRSDYQALGEFFQDVGAKEMARDFWGLENHRFVSPEKFLPWETGKTVTLRLPDASAVQAPIQRDRRDVLVDWMFGPASQQTARALVNRVWGKLLGRGIVEPVDDMRFSNPPVNEPLLNALAEDFIAHEWDFKHLVRAILNSRTWQLTSVPDGTNVLEEMNFSHARLKRLTAEQLLDAVAQVTGVPEEQPGWAPGDARAGLPYAGTPEVLTLFGRPAQRTSPCECIRSQELTLPQILHLLNGPTVGRKLRREGGTLNRLLAANLTDDQLVDELYLAVLSRPSNDAERLVGQEYLRTVPDRPEGAEDLMWALLTSQEFLFNH